MLQSCRIPSETTANSFTATNARVIVISVRSLFLMNHSLSSPRLCSAIIALLAISIACVADEPSVAVVMVLDSAHNELTVDSFASDVVIRRLPKQDDNGTKPPPPTLEPLPFVGEPLKLEQGTLLQILTGDLIVRLSAANGTTYDITGDGATVSITPNIVRGYIQLESGLVLVRGDEESGVETGLVNLGSKTTRYEVRVYQFDDMRVVDCLVYDGFVVAAQEEWTGREIGPFSKWSSTDRDASLEPVSGEEFLNALRMSFALDRAQETRQGRDIASIDSIIGDYQSISSG